MQLDVLAELLPLGWPTHVPLVRITTCGHLIVEVLRPVKHPSDEHVTFVYRAPEMPHNGGITALNLLKLLVSQPGCFATKDWLMETLRYSKPEEEEDGLWAGLARLDNIVSLLRGVLCPKGIPGEKTLRKLLVERVAPIPESGGGYRLAPFLRSGWM